MAMNDDLKINFNKVGKACRQVGEEWKKMMEENNPFDTISKIAKDIADRQDREIALEFTRCICELLKKNGVTPMLDEYKHETVKENSIECRYGVAITGLDFTEHDKRFKDEITQLKHDTKKMEDNIAKLKDKINNLRARCHKSAIDNFENGNYAGLFIVKADRLKNDDKVKELQCELDKTYNQLMEVEKDAQDKIAELESELEVKDNLLKIKNGLLGNNDELPTGPMEVVHMLINATYERETNAIERTLYKCGDTETLQRYSIDDLEQIAEHLLVYCKHNREEQD